MKRHPTPSAKSSARLGWLLIASFVLTIASFIVATVLSEHRARGIETAAESITTNALPSIGCLSRARTELRQIEMLLERLADRKPSGRRFEADLARLQHSRDAFAQERSMCIGLPAYVGERELEEATTMRVKEMDASIDGVIQTVQEGEKEAARIELLARTEPAIDQVDVAMVETINLNARHSASLGSEITSLKAASQSMRTFLIALAVVLAVTAGLMMVRLLNRFTHIMETRVSELETFAGRVAHDVRSHLASIGLALELTKRNPELGLRKGALDRAIKTLQRVGQLVDGLLIFARAGASPPGGTRADVGEVVSAVVEELRPSAEESSVVLCLEPPQEPTFVACSPGVLISLVSNLVGNAIKYMGESPVRRVLVTTRDEGEMVRFDVRDTGPGVQPSLRAHIFDPYVRAAESTVPGIGLGLATVRRLVEAHGGSVGVGPNEESGSLFWFELPKTDPAKQPTERRSRWRAMLAH